MLYGAGGFFESCICTDNRETFVHDRNLKSDGLMLPLYRLPTAICETLLNIKLLLGVNYYRLVRVTIGRHGLIIGLSYSSM